MINLNSSEAKHHSFGDIWIFKKNGLESAPTDQALTPEPVRPVKEASKIMHHSQAYIRVDTHDKPLPAVSETIAQVVRAIHAFPAKLSIGWQKSTSGLRCRYVVDCLSPRLSVDILQSDNDKILISMSCTDRWQHQYDELLPEFAHDLAYQIRAATLHSKKIKFKQPQLQNIGVAK